MDSEHLINDWPESINLNAPQRGISGVYQITNTSNGKFYIGSSQDIRERWRLHFWTLCAGTSHCKYLQSAWKKSGSKAFVFDILELCPQLSLLEREQFYIDTLEPVYNMCKIAGLRTGIPASEKALEYRRKPKSPESIEKMRIAVKQSYDVNPSLRELRRDTFQAVRKRNPNLMRGANNPWYGVPKEQIPGWLKLQTPEVEEKRRATRARMKAEGRAWRPSKLVEQLTLNGTVIKKWKSRIEAAAEIGCADVSISHACVGRTSSCFGFKWRYAE